LAKTKTSFCKWFVRDCSYRFMKENRRHEVVKNLSDLRVSLDVLLVALNQLVLKRIREKTLYLSDGEISKDFVVEVNVLFHSLSN
jgi:hypothetical protein